mgnify:CR=1 FL=1
MNIKKIVYSFFIIFFLNFWSNIAKSENSSFVVLKVNNQLITNIDIQNEKNYLLAINQNLESLDDKKLYEIAKASIIREKIKKNELKKYFNIDIYTKYIDNILEDFYTKLNFENIESLENYLLSKNLQIDTVKNKLNIEALWNELIYKRYNRHIGNIFIQRLFNNNNVCNVRTYILCGTSLVTRFWALSTDLLVLPQTSLLDNTVP